MVLQICLQILHEDVDKWHYLELMLPDRSRHKKYRQIRTFPGVKVHHHLGLRFQLLQNGLPDLKIANLFRDMNILKVAQKEAQEIINHNPYLEGEEYGPLRERIKGLFKEFDIIN